MTRPVNVIALEQVALELARLATVAFDASGDVAWLDEGGERLFDLPAGDAVGRPLGTLLPGLDAAAIGAMPIEIPDTIAKQAGGQSVRVSVRAKRTPDGHGVAVVEHLDVEDRELRESRDMLQAVADGTTAVIYIKDANGCYMFVNRRYEDLFDVRNEWLRGKTDYALFSREIADAVRANDEIVRVRGEPVEFDEAVPHRGELRQYISIKVPLLSPEGVVYAVCGISTDVTERKIAERELLETYEQLRQLGMDRGSRKSKEEGRRSALPSADRDGLVMQFGRLIAAARDGVWTIDTKGRTTFVNPRMARMLGYTVDEMRGRGVLDFVNPASRPFAEAALARHVKGVAEDVEIELQRKDGSVVWVLISVSPIRDAGGEVTGVLGMFTDFSERKRAEDHQRRLVRELDHRVKNNLALVSALADISMTETTTVSAFRESFQARLQALARTHEALARAGWVDISFDSVVALVLAPHLELPERRVVIEGPVVKLDPQLVTPLALALNELATNAIKHGALARPGGEVAVRWSNTTESSFTLTWNERSGSAVTEPEVEGVGLRLLRGLVEHELGGTLQYEFAADGFRCTVNVRLAE